MASTYEHQDRAPHADDVPPPRGSLLRRLAADRTALVGLAILVVLFAVALAAPLVAPHDPAAQDVTNRYAAPSWSHPLGTDSLGRDELSRLVYGARVSLLTAVVIGAIIISVGTAIGTLAGFTGGVVDGAIMRVVDVLLALPSLLLALAVVGFLGPSLVHLAVAMVAVWWVDYARLTRGLVLSVKERPYVEAAHGLGLPGWRVAGRHVLPNLIGPVIVLGTVRTGSILLALAALSFLGLGVSPPTAEWGAMLNDAKDSLAVAPELMLYPGLAITLAALGFNLVGDGLRDVLDPTLRTELRPDRRLGFRRAGRWLRARSAATRAGAAQPLSARGAVGALDAAGGGLQPGGSTRLLEVRELRTRFASAHGVVRAVDGVSLSLDRGERVGLVGESGSGKSVTGLSVMGLVRAPSATVTGDVRFDGTDLLTLGPRERRRLCGSRMAMVFQNPLSSLNPAMTIGDQIVEAIRTHRPVGRPAARRQTVELLDRVELPAPARNVDDYPHRLSGGMRQRAVIAMALSCDPDLLIADEPTAALDVTIQAQIVELLRSLAEERGMAVIFITHDLSLLAGFAERVAVMYAGRVVEEGPVDAIYHGASHPYTRGLLTSITRPNTTRPERLQPIEGQPPSAVRIPSGCPFHPRCPYAVERCVETVPQLALRDGTGHPSACHFAGELAAPDPPARRRR